LIDFDRPITLVILNAINQSLDSGFFIAFFSHFLHRSKKYFSTYLWGLLNFISFGYCKT